MLTLLCPTAEQDDETLTVSAEVDSVSRAKVDPVFADTRANALDVGEVPLCQSRQTYRNLGRSLRIQICEPFCESTATIRIEVFKNLNRI